MFNVIFLVTCILVLAVLILYLFFWNRFIGYILSLLIRITSWNQASSSMWIDIGSIQFSLLAGRILFKDLRYHSSNQTIRIVKGRISWRYWIRRPTEEHELSGARVGGEDTEVKKTRWPLNCRIHISVHGLEWFLYNRTAAYDSIIEQMQAEPAEPSYSDVNLERMEGVRKVESRLSARGDTYPPNTFPTSSSLFARAPSVFRNSLNWIKSQLPTLEFTDFLPVSIEVDKGAIVCGNTSTPNLLVAEYKTALGTFGVVPSRSKFDLYKQMLTIKFGNAVMHYAANVDYVAPMSTTGEKIHDRAKSRPSRRGSYMHYNVFQKLWRRVNLVALMMIPSYKDPERRPPVGNLNSFRGRRKAHESLDDETPLGADFTSLEYAIERKILEAPTLELSYYADAVGFVPADSAQHATSTEDPFDIGNGDLPPEWGIDLVVRNGILRYGPWSDRQRAELQRTFFPSAYRDVTRSARLKPGDRRVWPSMKVFLELRDSTTLEIPFREASKDWQWDGLVKYRRPRRREAASIYLRAGENSTISYITPMNAGPNGYEPLVEVHLDTVTVTSSLNDIRLLSAESCRVHCDLPSPLQWCAERQWVIAVSLRKPVMYLTREHINMFTDLGKDWSAGPPGEYLRFVPMIYVVEVDMQTYELNLYVNDHNIIDKPSIKEENALLTLRGASIKARVQVDSNQFRPLSSTVPFWVAAPDIMFHLTLPRWNTHSVRAAHRREIGRIGKFRLDGYYRYFSEAREDNLDQLKLEIYGHNVVLKTFGWVIRHFMVLRENYFGSFTQFSTLYEYLDKKKKGLPVADNIEAKYRPGKSNMLEVVLQVEVNRGLVILPAGLPGFEKLSDLDDDESAGIGACVLLSLPGLRIQLRTHDYFMEMSLNTDPISGAIGKDFMNNAIFSDPPYRQPQERILIDGLDVVANRLFGPEPHGSTYMCIWEIHVGKIKSSLSTLEGRVLLAAGNAFRTNFADVLNAPAKEHDLPLDPDVTFLKLSVDAIDATWQAGHAALEITVPKGLRVDSNDLAGQSYRKVTSIRLRHGFVKLLVASRPSQPTWTEAAHADFGVCLDIYDSPAGWRTAAKNQAAFLVDEDAPTGRARSLIAAHGFTEKKDTAVQKFGTGDLYLTPLRLPDTCGPAEQTPRAFQRHSLTQDGQSDSEVDEGVSEAMRDARLAKSRPVTPLLLLRPYDDGEMTSGDESDNEDLTDPEHSDSDWSESKETMSGTILAALISKYRRHTRTYMAHTKKPPSAWDGPAFQLVRDRRPSTSFHDSNSEENLNSVRLSPIPLDAKKDFGISTIRIRVEREIQVFFTPLVAPVIAQFLQDASLNQLSPELYFDSMLDDCINSMPDREPTPPTATVLDLALSSVNIRFLHEISPGKMESFSKPDVPPSMKPHSDGRVNILALKIVGFRAMGHDSPCGRAFKSALDSIAISIQSAEKNYTHGLPTVFKSIFSFSVGPFSSSLHRKKAEIHFDRVSGTIEHCSPTNIIASASAIGSVLKKIQAVHKRWDKYSFTRRQQLIRQVLAFSSSKSIIDPLSTIQPSYLIQSGRPHQLRTDPTFKFLFHLRIAIRYQDGEERRVIDEFHPETETTVTLEEVIPYFPEALSLYVDADVKETIEAMPLLLKLYPIRKNGSTDAPLEKLPDLFNLITFSLDVLQINLWNSDKQSRNELVIRSFKITAGQRKTSLIQATTIPVGKMVSQKEKVRRSCRHYAVNVSLGEIGLFIFPHLMDFIQQALRIRLKRPSVSKPQSLAEVATSKVPKQNAESIVLDIVFSLIKFRLRAAAEKLIIEFGITDLSLCSNAVLAPSTATGSKSNDLSMNCSILLAEAFLRACAAESARQNNQNVLASLTLTHGSVSAVVQKESSVGLVTRSVAGLGGLELSVPRSAIRLYRFVEEWRSDYLPGIQATIKALISEIRQDQKSPKQVTKKASKAPSIRFSISLRCLRVSLQVMHGTWVSWEVNNSTGFYKTAGNNKVPGLFSFGVQLGSQVFSISTKPHWSKNVLKNKSVKFGLPKISVTGNFDGSEIHTMALVDFFTLTSKPSHWDTLLSVQQKFGQDFNDLISLINEKRTDLALKRETPITPSKLKFSGFLKMRGFQIGLEGVSSALLLECQDIDGGFNNTTDCLWNVDVSDLSFSLAPRTSSQGGKSAFDRLGRSAFVVVDFQVSAGPRNNSSNQVLDISVTKIHAVMQPSSVGEFGDFVDHLQAELMLRAEQRAVELAEFKEKTRNVMRTFEARDGPPSPDAIQDWLSAYAIQFSFKNIGFAFPLAHDQEVKPGSQDSSAVGAFLFSIKSLVFSIHRGESGQAAMKGSSFQFVSRFRQSVPTDFIGETHQTRNRLLYPEMTAQLRTERSATSRRIRIGADVDGFILDIDSSIPDYVFSLIDVYRQGKARMDRLTASIPARTPIDVEATPQIPQTSLEPHYGAVRTSNIMGSLTFQSGRVRLYSSSAPSRRIRSVSLSMHEMSDDFISDEGVDFFNLPVVSVWAEYRATPAFHKIVESQEPSSTLTFKSNIHSSSNIFRPTFLPFLTELVDHVEDRMRKASLRDPTPLPKFSRTGSQSLVPAMNNSATLDPVSRMQISFSLRIDQSKLELTCHPDANVIAGVHWDSGGFVVNVSPGARQVAFTGSVAGLTIGLKHGFLSEDCVRLDARNLGFNVTFSQIEDEHNDPMRSVSAVMDTEFSGGVRFSRLQDILCFKAVWLDRIPVFSGRSQLSTELRKMDDALSPPSPVETTEQGLTTIIMLRFRNVKLDVDFGQSITSLTVDFKNAILRTKLTDEISEFSLSVEESSMQAVGNMSGNGHVPDFLFQTKRKPEKQDPDRLESHRMLDLTMTSGPLDIVLESDHQMLLQYHAEPLQVMIFDDWTKTSDNVPTDERRLRLSFTVFGKEVVAVATVGTIPKLVSYSNKFKANLEAQREGASRESKAFRIASSPKPDNPLSDVANAMFNSARTRLREAETGLSYIIRQEMSLRLETLRLVVFPRTMVDSEMVHFIGSEVHARLDRVVESEGLPPNRDLRLSFSFMTISKFSQIRHALSARREQYEAGWLASLLKSSQEAIIFGLPSMRIRMLTDEESNAWTKTIMYDFTSRFMRREGARSSEDIYITLNVSLYSWLTLLRKNFAREMNQVQASAERSVMGTAGVMSRKQAKSPDPIYEEPESIVGSPTVSRPPTPPLTVGSFPGPSPWKPNSKDDTNMTSPKSTMDSNLGWTPTTPAAASKKAVAIVYQPRTRRIERLNMRQLGEATPDVMHPFFMKKAGFSLEDSLPQYVHEYAAMPTEEIMKALLRLYSKQLKAKNGV